MKVILFTILVIATIVNAKPDGAPFESCIYLTPKHGSQPKQPSETNPYKVHASKTLDSKDQHEAVNVTISGENGDKFVGFIVQARLANNPTQLVDGRFVPEMSELSKTYTCRPGEKVINNVSV